MRMARTPARCADSWQVSVRCGQLAALAALGQRSSALVFRDAMASMSPNHGQTLQEKHYFDVAMLSSGSKHSVASASARVRSVLRRLA